MAKDVESNLTDHEERNSKQEQVSTSMCAELHQIMQVLTINREEAKNGLVAIGRKLNVSKDNIKDEALTSSNPPNQQHSEKERNGRAG